MIAREHVMKKIGKIMELVFYFELERHGMVMVERNGRTQFWRR